jgi:hypothetical protein
MSAVAFSQTQSVGEEVELARYTVCSGERILYGQWIDDGVCVTDRPACGPGRTYVVELCRDRDGFSALRALVADYTRQAGRLDDIPMVASVVRRIEQVELARYTFTGGERILYGQRVNSVVRVTDRPAAGPERSYLVECGLERDGFSALQALVADYTHQAGRLDEIPMAARPVGRTLEQEYRPRL